MSDRPGDITKEAWEAAVPMAEAFWAIHPRDVPDADTKMRGGPRAHYYAVQIATAIDQARREGYAAGVRAAAEVVERLSKEVENIDSFYRTAGELHMAEISAAQIRALDGKGGGV